MTKRRGSSRMTALVIVLAIFLALTITGGVLAKYVLVNIQKAEMVSAGFHISSNYLKDVESETSVVPDEAKYTVGAPGDLTIDLYNYEIENVAQRTEVNITYSVKVTNTDGTVTTTTGSFGTTVDENNPIVVTPAGTGIVTVEVTSTSPYVKTLKGQFTIATSAKPSYTLTAMSGEKAGSMLLKIHTNGYSGNINIQCNIAPDNANEKMEGWTTGNQGTLTVNPNETYELLFFGSATAVSNETTINDPSGAGVSVG